MWTYRQKHLLCVWVYRRKRGEKLSLFKSQRFTPFYISIVAIGPELLVSFNRKHVFNIFKVKQIMFFPLFFVTWKIPSIFLLHPIHPIQRYSGDRSLSLLSQGKEEGYTCEQKTWKKTTTTTKNRKHDSFKWPMRKPNRTTNCTSYTICAWWHQSRTSKSTATHVTEE